MPSPHNAPASNHGIPRRLREGILGALRLSREHAHSFVGAVGIFLVVGFGIAVVSTFVFATIAEIVREGATQGIDEKVLRWIAIHRRPYLDAAMVEITALGTGLVVGMVVAVASLFLSLTRHRYSALLLLVSTFGGLLLNVVLKMSFSRPRPQIIEWGTHAVTSSFPSGHAMSAAIVYGTVAYLAARLQERRWVRLLTMTVALLMIVMICLSRVYLGVHYPSDVLGGVFIGLAWAGFCMATLEAIQRYAERDSAQVLKHEESPPEHNQS